MAHPQVLSFLANQLGSDFPSVLRQALPRRHFCKFSFGKTIPGLCHLIMESKQPRLAFALRAFKQGQIIFTAEDCEINIYFDDAKAAEIQAEYQVALQDWPRPGDELVIFEIFPSKRPAMPAAIRSPPSDIEEAENWFHPNDPQLDYRRKSYLVDAATQEPPRRDTQACTMDARVRCCCPRSCK